MTSPGRKKLDTRRSRVPSVKSVLNSMLPEGQKLKIPIRTGRRRGVSTGLADPFPPAPLTWAGTLPEWAIYWAHSVIKREVETDFAYIYDLAGVEVDFYEFDLTLAIQVQGLYWHYEFSGGDTIQDLEERIRIESTGVQVINIDEDAALSDPVYFLREALEGRDHSLTGRGVI